MNNILILPDYFIEKVFMNQRLSVTATRVAIYLAKEIGFEKDSKLPKRKLMAELLQCNKSTINKALTELVENEIIMETEKSDKCFCGKFILLSGQDHIIQITKLCNLYDEAVTGTKTKGDIVKYLIDELKL